LKSSSKMRWRVFLCKDTLFVARRDIDESKVLSLPNCNHDFLLQTVPAYHYHHGNEFNSSRKANNRRLRLASANTAKTPHDIVRMHGGSFCFSLVRWLMSASSFPTPWQTASRPASWEVKGQARCVVVQCADQSIINPTLCTRTLPGSPACLSLTKSPLDKIPRTAENPLRLVFI